MKKWLQLGLLLLFTTAILSCMSDQEYANLVGSNLVYFKDLRTGLCFAYYKGGTGGAMSNVPCDCIPANLLLKVNAVEHEP